MQFFSSPKNKEASGVPSLPSSPGAPALGSARSPIVPNETEVVMLREIDEQRVKWAAFLKSRSDLNETWLWQYWRPESRPNNQIQKKIMSMFSSRLKAQKKVKSLVRNGIPPELRGDIWWACCGGAQKMEAASSSETYSALLGQIGGLDDSHVAFEIEKDLRRTFPTHAWIQSSEGQATMRRVLRCFALRNPVIGYCQSMNFLTAMLLLHMEEERAYWALCALIEDILPPMYYDPSMIGGRVDQQVLHSLIAWKLPQVHQVLKSTNTNLDPILCPWFLCLYINVLPINAACRVWDCVFWEGNSVLFRVGLSMLKSKSDEIIDASDMMMVFMALKSGPGGSMDGSYALSQNTTTDSGDAGDGDNDCNSAQNISATSELMDLSYRKRVGIGALPRNQVEKLRGKFLEIMLVRDAKWRKEQEELESSLATAASSSNNNNNVKSTNFKRSEKRASMSNKTEFVLKALEANGVQDLANIANDLKEDLDNEIEESVRALAGAAGDEEAEEGEEGDNDEN